MTGAGLSTGKVAELCSVNPDTVLKWIKKGVLPATRTVGGHYRIAEADLASLKGAPGVIEQLPTPAGVPCGRPLRCWEYLGGSRGVRDECKRCLVYQLRASWCFRFHRLGCDTGKMMNPELAECEKCSYYLRAAGRPTNVLIVTRDDQFAEALRAGKSGNVSLCFARNAWEASAAIGVHPIAFAVVDQDLLVDGHSELLDSLASDPRAPGIRVILASSSRRSGRLGPATRREIVDVVEKPFGVGRIVQVVNRFPVDRIPVSGS